MHHLAIFGSLTLLLENECKCNVSMSNIWYLSSLEWAENECKCNVSMSNIWYLSSLEWAENECKCNVSMSNIWYLSSLEWAEHECKRHCSRGVHFPLTQWLSAWHLAPSSFGWAYYRCLSIFCVRRHGEPTFLSFNVISTIVPWHYITILFCCDNMFLYWFTVSLYYLCYDGPCVLNFII